MDYIAIKRVVAGRHRRQRNTKISGARENRMQMKHRVHLGLANRIKMHQVAVVRQKVVVGAAAAIIIGMEGVHIQIQHIPGEHWINLQGSIDVERITCSLNIPPLRTAPDQERHKDDAACRSNRRSPATIRRWNRPGASRASRTAAATMPAILTTRKRPRIPSTVPSPRCIFSVERATAGTGTDAVRSPRFTGYLESNLPRP